MNSAPTASLLSHHNFTAIHMATPKFVFIGHLTNNFRNLPGIIKVEVYRIVQSGPRRGAETFIGYAEGEQFARLVGPLINAAEECLRRPNEKSITGLC